VAVALLSPILADLAWYVIAINVAILLLGIFMILLILIQRGKGGGLAGALGGAAGSSAFGTRAGDQFTKVTVWTALLWILLIMWAIKLPGCQPSEKAPAPPTTNTPEEPTSLLHHPHDATAVADSRERGGHAAEHDRLRRSQLPQR
jgi:preprotein translocase subunit SecG